MIFLGLIGLALLVIGIFLSFPLLFIMKKFNKSTVGIIKDIQDKPGAGDQPLKVKYVYRVKGHIYEGVTGWISHGYFSVGHNCTVKYNEEKPERSYIKYTGQSIRVVMGIVFLLIGIVAMVLAAILASSII